jgi:hypothetical protein
MSTLTAGLHSSVLNVPLLNNSRVLSLIGYSNLLRQSGTCLAANGADITLQLTVREISCAVFKLLITKFTLSVL